MLSINTALQVDLFDQANASYVRSRIYSGFGGQPDFVAGALHSTGGHAVMALRSWHDGRGRPTSSPGSSTPQPRSSTRSSSPSTGRPTCSAGGHGDQARLLIDRAADPRARAGLHEAAAAFGLHPYG